MMERLPGGVARACLLHISVGAKRCPPSHPRSWEVWKYDMWVRPFCWWPRNALQTLYKHQSISVRQHQHFYLSLSNSRIDGLCIHCSWPGMINWAYWTDFHSLPLQKWSLTQRVFRTTVNASSYKKKNEKALYLIKATDQPRDIAVLILSSCERREKREARRYLMPL